MIRALYVICLLPAACIDVPELDQAVPDWVESSKYPELVSLDGLQTGPLPGDEAEELEDELIARQSGLKRRAGALSGPVVDAETRARMADGIPQ